MNIKEWLVAVVLGVVCVSGAKAQDLSECQAAANLAYKLTLGVTEGFPLDNQQVNFPLAPTEAQEGNQRWAQMIKEKVKPLLPQILPQPHTPEAETLAIQIGNKLAEDCAYALGALRKVDKPGTATPLPETMWPKHWLLEILKNQYRRTASSEAVENPRLQKDRMCLAKRDAALWAIQMRNRGVTEETFLQLYPMPENWSQDLKDWALWMLKEAYRWPRGVEDFGKWIYTECWR